MLFSSLTFLFYFLPVTLALYYVLPKACRNGVLLVASLFFYAWGEPVYVVLMILSILLNYVCGREIYESDEYGRRRSLVIAVIINLAILGFFKYAGFFVETLNAVLPFDIPFRELALPIGISFYTFQAMSYLIDVYRGEVRAQKNILHFALYISMFPQLIAGPIVRYVDIEKQLKERRTSLALFGSGVRFFIIGLAKKVILANSIGAVFESIRGDFLGGEAFVLTSWIGALAYALQIYFDFSGYSDMAIGLGKMFGFELLENFHYPYLADSITDFWRRWHISLSTWFREYVYIPLGGNRRGIPRQILNLLIVWSLTGFWHGAAWNFMFWGFYYGVLLVIEKFILGGLLDHLPGFVRRIYTLVLVLIGWVFFFSNSLSEAFAYIGSMFGAGTAGFANGQTWFVLATHWLLWIVSIVSATGIVTRIVNRSGYTGSRRWLTDVGYAALFLLSISALITDSFNPFLYFRF